MTPEELKAIEERVSRAQVGPWKATGFEKGKYPGNDWPLVFSAGEGRDGKHWAVETDGIRGSMTNGAGAEEDAEFVAHARQDVPRLLAEVERFRDALSSKIVDTCAKEAGRDLREKAKSLILEFTEKLKHPLPCGHELGDLTWAPGSITTCGACVMARKEARHA